MANAWSLWLGVAYRKDIMRTYVVQTSHQFQNGDERAVHKHRVSMPDEVYKKLQKKWGTSRWAYHNWVEKQLKKRLGYDNGWSLDRNKYYYIISCKLES